MNISLADKSVVRPKGIVENVLVKVDKCLFPIDFVVVDSAYDAKCPLILGKPGEVESEKLVEIAEGEVVVEASVEKELVVDRVVRKATLGDLVGYDDRLMFRPSVGKLKEICEIHDNGVEWEGFPGMVLRFSDIHAFMLTQSSMEDLRVSGEIRGHMKIGEKQRRNRRKEKKKS
ncbi:hypothetical protein SSX86_011175 [Deinandra increscens subsp. villosa]|uniref:Uncharacterized protein n=1 Tax=Deinandra increscens subsp. villosa TaxID=3103831 RepID=A0AAP0DD43_9ASTR